MNITFPSGDGIDRSFLLVCSPLKNSPESGFTYSKHAQSSAEFLRLVFPADTQKTSVFSLQGFGLISGNK